ncbi:oligopeptide transporter 4 [Asimina triloba]
MGAVAADYPPKPFDLVDPVDDDEISPVEQVRLTVTNTDDPLLPVWTFRMWFLGVVSCAVMSFLNQFFAYRTEPLVITQISVQVASLPAGHFLAKVLPCGRFRLPGFGAREFSLNPGPFNMKEHVLISIFANAGYAFGNGSAYAVGIVNIIKAFYHRSISFHTGWILIITTQLSIRSARGSLVGIGIGAGIRMGGAASEVCSGAGPHVVAQHTRASLPLQPSWIITDPFTSRIRGPT